MESCFDLVGWGRALPEQIVTNEDYERDYGVPASWIEKSMGVESRRILPGHLCASDLGIMAAKNAFKVSGVRPAEIDLIISATISADYIVPPTSAIIQAKIEAPNSAILDLNTACMSFISGVSVAAQYLNSGIFKTALVVTSEVASRARNFEDKSSFPLLGDGAGAVIMKKSAGKSGIVKSYFRADGSKWDHAMIKGFGAHPSHYEHLAAHQSRSHFQMKGMKIYTDAVLLMVEVVEHLTRNSDLGLEQIDLIIPHQANINILEGVKHRLKGAKNKVFINMKNLGNTSSATVAIALAESLEKGLISKGSHAILVGFGAGINWGGILLRL